MEVLLCLQKERYIQVSKVDEEESKRKKQQEVEREQVSLLTRLFKLRCVTEGKRVVCSG